MGSSRLPGKVMLRLAGEPVLFHVVERVKRARLIDIVIVATSDQPEDDAIEALCKERGYACFRGSQNDVLSRYAGAALAFDLQTIVRITSDCPLIDPSIADQTVKAFESSQCDYLSNVLPEVRTFPRGLDCEVFSRGAIERAAREATEPYEREHVTPYIHENKKGIFKIGPQFTAPAEYARPKYRLTLDYQEDYEFFKHIYDQFYKPEEIIDVPSVLHYLDEHPEVVAINAAREAEYPQKGIRV